MTTTLSKLIDTCYNIQVILKVSHYELHQFEDGSYCDFRVRQIADLRLLLMKADLHNVKLFAEGDDIIVRVFEKI